MNKIFLTSFIVLYLSSVGISQKIMNGRFIKNSVDGNTYVVKLQINSNSSENYLGSSNFRFSFEGDISFSNNPVQGTDYNFFNFSGNNYQTAYLTSPASDQISINIELNSPYHGTYIAESPNWTDVVEFYFNIENPEGFANLKWTPSATVAFSDDETSLFEKGIISDLTSPLPVELVSFTASISNGKVLILWIISSEINNAGFSLQRSEDNEKFEEVAFIKGNGTTTSTSEYSYKDISALSGKYYYRLKQIDFNGSFYYSNSIEIDLGIPKNFILDQNYPNPFNPTTTIRFSIPIDAKVNIKLFNTLGEEVATIIKNELDTGIHEINYSASDFSSGVYFYRLEAEGKDGSVFAETKRMILIK
jgi:hypothetical protein